MRFLHHGGNIPFSSPLLQQHFVQRDPYTIPTSSNDSLHAVWLYLLKGLIISLTSKCMQPKHIKVLWETSDRDPFLNHVILPLRNVVSESGHFTATAFQVATMKLRGLSYGYLSHKPCDWIHGG